MKRSLSLLTALAFVLTFSGSVFGQVTQDVSATAEVAAEISLTKNNDVNFGTVQETSTPDIEPNDENTDVGEDAQYGKITISAANSTQLFVEWDQSTVTLETSDGNNSMTYTPLVTANSSDDAGNSNEISSGNASSDTETSGSGDLYLYIGGDLGSLSDQASGTYTSADGSGDLSFTVNYD